jgi:hypothetical protein
MLNISQPEYQEPADPGKGGETPDNIPDSPIGNKHRCSSANSAIHSPVQFIPTCDTAFA